MTSDWVVAFLTRSSVSATKARLLLVTCHSSLVTVFRRRSSTESERRATNAKVVGSSPSVFTKVFKYGDECKASSTQFFKLILAGSSPAFPSKDHFGFVQSAGRLALNQQIEVRILDPKPIQVSGRSSRWLYGLDLESSVRRFKSCRPDQTHARVA